MSLDIQQIEVNRINPQGEDAQVLAPVILVRQEHSCPDVMTEQEVIEYLRIPEVSEAKDFKNAIDNLIRFRGLPCIHISRKRLYPLQLVREWVLGQEVRGAA
jgi:hypothetical protein